LFNEFAAVDNLAWIWVSETGLKRPNGKTLSASQVGLTRGHAVVRQSLSQPFQKRLEEYDKWFEYMKTLRHARLRLSVH
jgi:hypothetical protein